MSVTIGEYTITKVEGDANCDYFIQHSDGEGMGLSAEDLRKMFADFFFENF